MSKRTMNPQRRPAGRSTPPARATLDAMTGGDGTPPEAETPSTTIRRVGIVLNAREDAGPVFAKVAAKMRAAAKAAGNPKVQANANRQPSGGKGRRGQ